MYQDREIKFIGQEIWVGCLLNIGKILESYRECERVPPILILVLLLVLLLVYIVIENILFLESYWKSVRE